MTISRQLAVRLAGVLLLLLWSAAEPLSAQAPATFTARLSPVPVDATTQPKTVGSGSVKGTLSGTTLSIAGDFKGLLTNATTADVHVGPRGLKGPAVLPLQVSTATSGSIRGELKLSSAQVDHLRRGRLYVQIQSDALPEGNLWGWLLP